MNKKNIKKINSIISSEEYSKNKEDILNLLKDSESYNLFIEKFPNQINNLEEVDFLLQKLKDDERYSKLSKILEESLKDNIQYIVDFIKENYFDFAKKRSVSYQSQSLKILLKILETNSETADKIFELIQDILKERQDAYKKDNKKGKYGSEERYISKVILELFKVFEKEKKEEIVKIISNHFTLIRDEGIYSLYTPDDIFNVLKIYLSVDFKKRIEKVKDIIVEQYVEQYDNSFEGSELVGGTISVSGGNYNISEKKFVKFSLRPALKDFYKEDQDWEYIKNEFIFYDEEISKDNPNFLNKAALPIVLKVYKDNDLESQQGQEAFRILREFIVSKEGIPKKHLYIFKEAQNLSTEKKKKLLEVGFKENDGLPLNLFMENVVLSLLKDENSKDYALEYVQEWIKDPNYSNRGRFHGGGVSRVLNSLLKLNNAKGLSLFREYIKSNSFNKLENFQAFEITESLNKFLQKNPEAVLNLFLEIYRNEESLTKNQQIIVCNSLTRNKIENKELLDKIYNDFLKEEILSKSIEEIEEKINHAPARESFPEFAATLAKNKKIEKAIKIIELFIKDSSPTEESRETKKIRNGEEVSSISTVRGWCAWALSRCVDISGRDYIDKIITLTKKLTEDHNYYIKNMACFPLVELARVRLATMPSKDELFFEVNVEKALKRSKKVEKISFDLLHSISDLDEKPKNVLMKQLLRVFGHIKTLNETEAKKLISEIEKCNDEVVAEAAFMFIFYAEFRESVFKDWKWKTDDIYENVEEFDSSWFQEELEKIISENNSKLNSRLANEFYKIVRNSTKSKDRIKNKIHYDKAFEVANKYMKMIVDNGEYDYQVFSTIFNFINENINKKFDECYEILEKIIEIEKKEVKEKIKEERLDITFQASYRVSNQILQKIREEADQEKFLESVKSLLEYPREVSTIRKIDDVVKDLYDISEDYSDDVEEIFDLLIEKINKVKYKEEKEKWKKQSD